MNWFYTTRDRTQTGPVDEATLASLFQSGAITSETLVWREGMDGWQPYSVVFARIPAAAVAPLVPDLTRCAECGRSFPPEELIPLAGRSICGECKPIAVQKLQEGVVGFGDPANAEELWKQVQERGFDFTIGSVLSRSWKLVRGNFWPCLGVTLLGYLVFMASGQIPLLGLLATFLVQSQMMAGLSWYFLRQFRGQPATLNDSFAGFRRGFGQQALYMLVFCAIIFVGMLVFVVPLVAFTPGLFTGSPGADASAPIIPTFVFLLIIPIVLAIWYLTLSWIFTPLLILDKGLKALPAMTLSRRVVHLHFWKLLGLFLVVGLLCMLGLIALIVGVLVMLPVAFAVLARVYEDAFGERAA